MPVSSRSDKDFDDLVHRACSEDTSEEDRSQALWGVIFHPRVQSAFDGSRGKWELDQFLREAKHQNTRRGRAAVILGYDSRASIEWEFHKYLNYEPTRGRYAGQRRIRRYDTDEDSQESFEVFIRRMLWKFARYLQKKADNEEIAGDVDPDDQRDDSTVVDHSELAVSTVSDETGEDCRALLEDFLYGPMDLSKTEETYRCLEALKESEWVEKQAAALESGENAVVLEKGAFLNVVRHMEGPCRDVLIHRIINQKTHKEIGQIMAEDECWPNVDLSQGERSLHDAARNRIRNSKGNCKEQFEGLPGAEEVDIERFL